MRTIDGEIVAVHVEMDTPEPAPTLWLRLVVWLPSLFAAVIGVSLVAGALRCSG